MNKITEPFYAVFKIVFVCCAIFTNYNRNSSGNKFVCQPLKVEFKFSRKIFRKISEKLRRERKSEIY